MPDYKQGKIYQIVSSQCDKVYVGSTTTTLARRITQHRSSIGCRSSIILAFDDARIELIENYPCDSKKELVRREGEVMLSYKYVNRAVAGRTKKESCKAYYESHKEQIQSYRNT